ncbi:MULTISPECIES: protein NnrT [Thioclava]|uniref:protein NnrT n=1 Tax=Thioclava TaxID=285107 RepID=UPI000C3CA579|nr:MULTISPECIES: protein NnrT [Thioclava]MAQ36922.1 protein NnrT [Thioclava sp.]|tara:strand:+ start:453 stop:626 length:174 start_codon:yes stop_codon:yes gene_type:complete
MRKLTLLLALAPAAAQAASFERPIPQAQSATAEFWFALATLALIAALAVMARVVARR